VPDPSLASALAEFCKRQFVGGSMENLRQLSGGASMESWAFSCGNRDMVLRRLPSGMADLDVDSSVTAISLPAQADLIELAGRSGVTAPQVLAKLQPSDGIGSGFIMSKADGEALPHKILGNPNYAVAEAQLAKQCARELAAIHAMDTDQLPDEIQVVTAAQLLKQQEEFYRSLQVQIPIFDFAIGWLERHSPPPTKSCLVHADFRMGNLMIGGDGITAVLDWELAHLGDPMEDLAYICTPSWRFGNYEKEAGGFDKADNLISAYENETGSQVNRDHFNWWLTYNTLWWGIACLRMGNAYRDGSVPTLERTIIGRRVSEVEIDLLLQFGDLQDADQTTADISFIPPALQPDAGEVTYSEIAKALSEWNKAANIPQASGHALFEARVGGNALGILQRDAAFGQIFAARQAQRRDRLGVTQDQLCEDLRSGQMDLSEAALWDHLRLTALERILIDQPKYAGFLVAQARWIGAVD